jgi:hypothetical protein
MSNILNLNDDKILLGLYKLIVNPSKFVVDIGSSTGISTDPVFKFITDTSFDGLCIEGNKLSASILKNKTHFQIYDSYIFPHNIIDVFKSFNVPINLDILKIDIDGFDLEVLRQILTIYKPSIIIAEINEKIPPPIKLEVLYKKNYVWDYSHLFGFSIQSGNEVMHAFGYKISKIYDLNNIICLNGELCSKVGLENIQDVSVLYSSQYINDKRRYDYLPWNYNVEHWLHIKDKDILKKTIRDYYTLDNNRSQFPVKTKIEGVDFLIDF